MSDYTYLSAADTAKLIRVQLSKHFPTTKFYVNSKTYSGGASIDIDWYDGPTSEQVKAITNPFSGAGFDGMTDYKTSHTSWLLPDGSAHFQTYQNDYFTETVYTKPHPDAKLVHFGADYIFENRHLTTVVKPLILAVCKEHGYPEPEFHESHPWIAKKQRNDITVLSWDSRNFDHWQNQEIRDALNVDLSQTPAPQITADPQTVVPEAVEISWDREWTWIKFPEKPSEKVRELLKNTLSARYSGRREAWYVMEQIDETTIRMQLTL